MNTGVSTATPISPTTDQASPRSRSTRQITANAPAPNIAISTTLVRVRTTSSPISVVWPAKYAATSASSGGQPVAPRAMLITATMIAKPSAARPARRVMVMRPL
jgi:hypothetical protein